MNEFNWVDLSEYGLQVILTKLPNGKKFLVAWGADESNTEQLEQIGFIARKNDPSVMFASREKLGSSFFVKMKQFFPKAKTVKLPVDKVVVPDLKAWATSMRAQESGEINEEKMKADLTELRVELSQDRLLGVNTRDEKVYKTPEGRVCVGADGEVKMMNFKSDKSLFLISGDKRSMLNNTAPSAALIKSVEPFAKEIAQGKIYHFDDMKRIVEIIFDLDDSFDAVTENTQDAGASILRRVETALSLSCEQYAINQLDYENEAELGDAIDSLYERTPRTPASYFGSSSVILNTPLSQADLINKLVMAKEAKSMTITASVPGYLEAILPKSTKILSRISNSGANPQTSDLLSPTSAPNVKFTSAQLSGTIDTDKKQDFLFINEVPHDIAPKTFDSVRYTRGDLYQSAYNLMAMDDDGAAVIAIQEPLNADNKVDGEFKDFLDWLYPRFGVKGVAHVDGDLYGRSGSTNNVRLIYIEGRNLIPELDITPPTELVEVNEHSALRNMSNIWLAEEAKVKVEESKSEDRKVARLSEILTQDNDAIKLKGNEHQRPYLTTSKIQSGGAMVNKDLELATRKAHARLVRDVGDIDAYVAEKLQMTDDQLHRCFFGEQVSSIAQMIYNVENDKPFLLGDAPGQGKGRQLAAIMRFRLLRGETVLFITENSDLFRDIMRDMDDIESAHLIKPYVVDNKKSVTMMDGTVLDEGSAERNDVLLKGHIDTSNYNVLFTTYVQLRPIRDRQRKNGRLKTTYIDSHQLKTIEEVREQNGGLGVISDESHNGASIVGNTNNVMERVLDFDKAAVLSSGTSARHNKNLSFYHRLIDIIPTREDFQEILKKGGKNVTTAFVQMLAEAGMYVRREEDLSKADYRTLKDVTPTPYTKNVIDSVSRVFSLMGTLTRSSQKHVFNNDKEDQLTAMLEKFGGKLGDRSALAMGSSHFTSRFNNLQNQLVNTLSVPTVLENVKKAIQDNEKPIITFSNTGSSFTERYCEKMIAIAEAMEDGNRNVNPILADNVPTKVDGEWVFNRVPSFKEVLYFAIEDVMKFKIDVNNGRNSVYVDLGDLCTDQEGSLAIQQISEELKKSIEAVPNIPFAPIDILYDELSKVGLNCKEITGRKKGFLSTPDGKWTYSFLDKLPKNEVIDGFNNGIVDVALINSAGGTGFSYHAAPPDHKNGKHLDCRQRNMFFLEYLSDVLKQKQIENRTNRKGQIENPIYSSVELDFPVAQMLLSLQNVKRAEFSACVTGSDEADIKLKTSADFMNPVGGKVCMTYLEENPDIADAMGFDVDGFVVDGKYQFDGFQTKFKDALIRLPYDQQAVVYEEIKAAYANEVEYLNSTGNNMQDKSVFDFGAETLQETVISGDVSDFRESAFQTPVKVRQLSYKPQVGMTPEALSANIKEYNLFLQEQVQGHGYESYVDLVDGVSSYLDNNRKSFIEKLQNADPSTINEYDKKIDAVKEILPQLFVGQVVTLTDRFDKTASATDGVIVHPKFKPKNPLEWSFFVMKPGDDYGEFFRVRDIVKENIKNKELGDKADEPSIRFTGREFSMNSDLARQFKSAKSKYATKTRTALVGNPIEMITIALDIGSGTSGKYTADDGTVHNCVMMPKGMTFDQVVYRPQKLSSADMALKYFAHNLNSTGKFGSIEQVTIDTSSTGYSQTQDVKLTVNNSSDDLIICYPKNKKHGGPFKDSTFNSALGSGAVIEGKKAYNVATTDLSNLDSVLRFLYDNDIKLKSGGKLSNFENSIKNGEIVVETRDVVKAFSDTSYLDEPENNMTV